MSEEEREAKRRRIAQLIKEAEDEGLYELSEHLTPKFWLEKGEITLYTLWTEDQGSWLNIEGGPVLFSTRKEAEKRLTTRH